jgi:putative ABC transport system ATP-binding protein/lipoprotein-releasing system ATP-binding protein
MGIVLRDVVKSFGTPPTRALDGVTLTLNDGEFISLTGRSGSGKSTLLYIVSSLDTATSGTVEIDGKNIKSLGVRPLHEFRNTDMGFVFQFHYLLPELTAIENVLMPAMKTKRHHELHDYGVSLLAEFGLEQKTRRFPSQLSGGEQQRVAIARSLVMSPRYLFADEPTGNLDSASGDTVMTLLKRVNAERGTTVVMVTHDPDYAALAPRRIHLVDGRVVKDESNAYSG